MPYCTTDVTGLIVTFSRTGESVTVNDVFQSTGVTINGDYAFLTSNLSSKIMQCVVDEAGLFTNCVNVDLASKLANGALSISVAGW